MQPNGKEKYNQLHSLARHAKILRGVSHILEWDQETYMPEGAFEVRAEQIKTLAGLIHQEKTSKKYARALQSLIDLKTGRIKDPSLTASKKRALVLWRRDFLKEKCLPKAFVEEFAALSSKAMAVWRKSKQHSSFKEFSPLLKKIVTMCRKKADYLGFLEHPYDALIDEYEPSITTREIEVLFDQVGSFCSRLVKSQRDVKREDKFLLETFDKDLLMQLGVDILKDMGYDFAYGRLDFSAHPFSSSSHPKDSRITTRVPKDRFMIFISTLLHEGGHSLYEMGLPEKEFGTPLGESVSLGIHESQSRFWEVWVGHSTPFWKKYFPLVQKIFRGKWNHVTLDAFQKAINKVSPSLIRTEADLVTYPLHVILRFEIEKGLIEGSIRVENIPEVWNEMMKTLLGIVPKNDAEGCLQDIHWSMGAFGYFPTYALGSLYAAEIFEAFEKEYPDYDKRIQKEGLLFIKDFLNKKIYRFGRQFDSKDLIRKVTGKPFSVEPFKRYLEKRFQQEV